MLTNVKSLLCRQLGNGLTEGFLCNWNKVVTILRPQLKITDV
jgi:hypothetical protein